MKRSMRLAIGVACLVTVALAGCQRRMIYMPWRYSSDALAQARALGLPAVEARYALNAQDAATAKDQVAYYVGPRDGSARPDRLWVVFSGNASFALGWTRFVLADPDPRAAFLLVDYPGYGANSGRPTRQSIIDAGVAALAAVQRQQGLGATATTPAVPVGLLGHSLGAAAVLELAVRSHPDRVVLISPFTSMMAMARRRVGWPACLCLLDRFDNAARLNELSARSPQPSITILHGTADPVIPFVMGRALAEAHSGWIRFVPIFGGDHNRILKWNRAEIQAAMYAEAARRAAPESASGREMPSGAKINGMLTTR